MNLIGKLIMSCCIATSLQASAMIIRHDKNDSEYVKQEADFPAIFPLHDNGKLKNCVGTMLASQWAITAAHCTILLKPGSKFVIAGNDAEVSSIYMPPEYGYMKIIRNSQGDIVGVEDKVKDQSFDIALIKLASPIKNINTLPLLASEVKVNQIIEVMGWGDFGNGVTGVSRQDRVNDRKFRVAHNKIEAVDGNYLVFNFDAPNSGNTLQLEGINGPGDSGSPALVKIDSVYYVAGISSAGDYPNEQKHEREGKYGWQEYYISVNTLKSWITQTMSVQQRKSQSSN